MGPLQGSPQRCILILKNGNVAFLFHLFSTMSLLAVNDYRYVIDILLPCRFLPTDVVTLQKPDDRKEKVQFPSAQRPRSAQRANGRVAHLRSPVTTTECRLPHVDLQTSHGGHRFRFKDFRFKDQWHRHYARGFLRRRGGESPPS